MTRKYIRIALHILNVLQILKSHKVQYDLKRRFHDWDFQFTFCLPPFLVTILLNSLAQIVIISGFLQVEFCSIILSLDSHPLILSSIAVGVV